MDTQQIIEILSKNVKTKHSFLGVFASDQLPSTIPHYPVCFVANTDKSSEEGSHWVAFYVNSPTSICFFDSYGNPPMYFEGGISRYVEYYEDLEFNPMRLQSNVTSVCGQYCIYYLYAKCNDCSLNDILLSFIPNQLCNDRKVHHFVTKRFKVVVPFYQ